MSDDKNVGRRSRRRRDGPDLLSRPPNVELCNPHPTSAPDPAQRARVLSYDDTPTGDTPNGDVLPAEELRAERQS